VLGGVFKATTSEDLKGFIGWLPMLGTDDAVAASRQAAQFRDPRITEAWDGDRKAGLLFAHRLGLEGIAWDVYLVYGRGVRWENDEQPPMPGIWMHQLRASTGADPKLRLDHNRLTSEVLALIDRKD
jgi:hypothetical protein